MKLTHKKLILYDLLNIWAPNGGFKIRVAFFTLGCKVNQYETEVLKSLFFEYGFDVSADNESLFNSDCDVAVINSCTVTGSGDKKTKQLIRKLKRDNPNIIIALTGCFPQAFPKEAADFFEADVITGSYNRSSLPKDVSKFVQSQQRIVNITPHKNGEAFEKMKVSNFSQKTRAFIKIQDGCDRYCSYCIIPYARGSLRSKALEDIKSEVNSLAQNGYKEIVLVGINLSKYGVDIGLNLNHAVAAVCNVDDIKRVRLGSLEPDLLTEDLIQNLSLHQKLCPQFHLSLQSGCDRTLKRMNRHYTAAQYADIVNLMRKYFKDCAITTDVMVGFPGETTDEFHESLDFVLKTRFAKVHAFAYSIRPGTVAANMPCQIDAPTKKLRSDILIQKTDEIRGNILKSKIGSSVVILCETLKNGFIDGYTEDYTPCIFSSEIDYKNQLALVQIKKYEYSKCYCDLLQILTD